MNTRLVIAFLVLTSTALSQQLRTNWSVDTIQIGEQVRLTITLTKAPKAADYRPYAGEVACEIRNDSASLTTNGTLEIIGQFRDSSYRKNGKHFWTGTYTLTAWDTGVYIFPRVNVLVGDSVYSSQPQPLTVSFVKKKVGDELEEVPVVVETDYLRWLKRYWWIGLLVLAVGVIWWIRKRNNRQPPVVLSLKERTLLGIQALRKQGYWKRGEINTHYIEFSFLLRSFLSARYELNLMERTTYETIVLLRARQLPEATLERIRHLLQESDIVKFALGIPDETTIVLGMDYLEKLVIELSPLELLHE